MNENEKTKINQIESKIDVKSRIITQTDERKVYCCNCRYFVLGTIADYCAYSDYCYAPTGKIINDYIVGKYKERINKDVNDKDYPNNKKTNGCKYYKRKWWKFWIQ